MRISIIIPCKDDKKVINCVDSIDDPMVEVVIVFNGSTTTFVTWVKKNLLGRAVKYLNIGEANLALALETGTWSASNDLILYIDSDCIFEKGAIRRFKKVAQNGNPGNEVFKGEVIFSHNGWVSKIVAKSRQHHTGERLTAYKPPLLISKKIAGKIGGYFFNKKLIWREDSDLDNRIRNAGIKILPVKGGIIYHGAITIKTDLRSTFRYGIGGAIADTLNIKLTEVPRSFKSTLKSQGIIPALYMLFRNRFYTAGYYYFLLKEGHYNFIIAKILKAKSSNLFSSFL